MKIEDAERIYSENLDSLLPHEGEFILIHENGIEEEFWESYEQALEEGYQRFGVSKFMVKRIDRDESVHFVSRDVKICRD